MMTCVAIDDEPLALDLVSSYIGRTASLQLANSFTDAIQATKYLSSEYIDLIFLDIEMPDINGIQLYKSLQNPPMVIFTTAYSQYAVDGFNLDAIDYLLKPIEFDRFSRAVHKAQEYQQYQADMNRANQQFIFVKSEYQLIKINFKDIEYIEGLDDYVKIYAGGKPILSLMSMKAILGKLPVKEFVRVHRSYIVSISKIDSIQRNRIKIGQKLIPISDNYNEGFYNLIGS